MYEIYIHAVLVRVCLGQVKGRTRQYWPAIASVCEGKAGTAMAVPRCTAHSGPG